MSDKTLTFEYKNWRGEVDIRTVIPIEVYWGSTEYHPKEQWMLKALDLKKHDYRDFAVEDIIRFIK